MGQLQRKVIAQGKFRRQLAPPTSHTLGPSYEAKRQAQRPHRYIPEVLPLYKGRGAGPRGCSTYSCHIRGLETMEMKSSSQGDCLTLQSKSWPSCAFSVGSWVSQDQDANKVASGEWKMDA